MQIEELLERNQKGVQDLLHHEVGEFALAAMLASLPDAAPLLQEVETMLYKRVTGVVQGILQDILANLVLEENLAYDLDEMRAHIQTFVNEQVKDTTAQLQEKIRWWQKKLPD